MIDCIVSENIENLDTTKPVGVVGGTQTVFSGCSFALNQHVSVNKNGVLQLSGSNTTLATIIGSGSVLLASGAIVNLTGNTNTTPIALGGGVVVSGGCTVINSAGASVSIAGGTYTRINKDGTTE